MSDETNQVQATEEPVAETATEEAAPASEPVPPSSTEQAIEAAVGRWINGHLTNSPLAQATEAWNHVMGSLNIFRGYLKEELDKFLGSATEEKPSGE